MCDPTLEIGERSFQAFAFRRQIDHRGQGQVADDLPDDHSRRLVGNRQFGRYRERRRVKLGKGAEERLLIVERRGSAACGMVSSSGSDRFL